MVISSGVVEQLLRRDHSQRPRGHSVHARRAPRTRRGTEHACNKGNPKAYTIAARGRLPHRAGGRGKTAQWDLLDALWGPCRERGADARSVGNVLMSHQEELDPKLSCKCLSCVLLCASGAIRVFFWSSRTRHRYSKAKASASGSQRIIDPDTYGQSSNRTGLAPLMDDHVSSACFL